MGESQFNLLEERLYSNSVTKEFLIFAFQHLSLLNDQIVNYVVKSITQEHILSKHKISSLRNIFSILDFGVRLDVF
jgi:hypothetical protein